MITIYLFTSSPHNGENPALAPELLSSCTCPGRWWTLQPLLGPNQSNEEINTKLEMWRWEWLWKELQIICGKIKKNEGIWKAARGGKQGQMWAGGRGLQGAWVKGWRNFGVNDSTEKMRSSWWRAAGEWVALLLLFVGSPFRFFQKWKKRLVAFSLFFMTALCFCKSDLSLGLSRKCPCYKCAVKTSS